MKTQAQAHREWWLLDEDECWFSRFAQPQLHAWAGEQALRLVQRSPDTKQPEKALACFGALCQMTQQVYLYFSQGQPDSEQTWMFIVALLRLAQAQGKRVLALIWDNARWHTSRRLRAWIRAYNRLAKQAGAVRLLIHWLPLKSPWLNPIEPHWVHAKRQVCEPDGALSPAELRRRMVAYFATEPLFNSFNLCDAGLH